MVAVLTLGLLMFVTPIKFQEHVIAIQDKEKEVGWQAAVSQPFLDKKKQWCVTFVLEGVRNEKGQIGYYDTIEVRGVVEKVFVPFKDQDIQDKMRAAYYRNDEPPERIKTSIHSGEVFISVIYFLHSSGKIVPLYIAHGE